MALRDIVIEKETVKVGKVDFQVTGLTLNHLATLVESHAHLLDKMFSGKMDANDLVSISPDLAAKIIAMAADDYPDGYEVALHLPLTAQLLALEKIWNLTVPDPDTLKKLWDRLGGLLAEARKTPRK